MAGELKRITSGVKLTIDGFEFSIEPGSFSYKDGFPVRATKGTVNGVYYSDNYEEAKGMMKFSVPNTKANDDSLRSLRTRSALTAKATEIGGSFSKVMKSGVIINDDEPSTGADGMIEISIEGTRLD